MFQKVLMLQYVSENLCSNLLNQRNDSKNKFVMNVTIQFKWGPLGMSQFSIY